MLDNTLLTAVGALIGKQCCWFMHDRSEDIRCSQMSRALPTVFFSPVHRQLRK